MNRCPPKSLSGPCLLALLQLLIYSLSLCLESFLYNLALLDMLIPLTEDKPNILSRYL
ncbi:hypothetical protein BDV35DRAFT_337644, partial [Aspergillus flavus]